MKTLYCVVLLLAAVGPITCLRPLEQLSNFAASFSRGASVTEDTPVVAGAPWFCHDLDCPKYKVLNHSAGYETRHYEQGRWASTVVSGLLYETSVTTGFKRLFEYISGDNEDGTKIPMTSPVLTAIQPGQGAFCKSNFTVSFFLPFDFQKSTPKPNDADVFLFTSPEGTVFISQFGGYLVDDVTLSLKIKALHKDLADNSESFLDGSYFTASYDPPFRVQHRHNEIWVAQKPDVKFVA